MTGLSHHTVLIIDFSGAGKLRERLLPTGASVHVVSAAAARIWARVKRIDAAFIRFEDASTELCEQLTALGVRPIIVTAEDATGVASTSTSWRSVLGSQPARRMEPSGSYPH